ncbi:MAG: hypothetical protein ABIO70_09745 [Pseudomonadota bacterium]
MIRIVVVCEGSSEPARLATLADRVFERDAPWFGDQEDRTALRRYTGIEGGWDFLAWKDVKRLHRRWVRLDGFRGRDGATGGDHIAARKALMLLAHVHHDDDPIDGVLLFRDEDRPGTGRAPQIKAARDEFRGRWDAGATHPWRRHVAVGVAVPKMEAWVLAGFVPQPGTDEAQRLEAQRRDLGYSPADHPHELWASDRAVSSKKSAKKVCWDLCPTDERQIACLAETDLEVLCDRGQGAGLAGFVEELHCELSPLFGGRGNP